MNKVVEFLSEQEELDFKDASKRNIILWIYLICLNYPTKEHAQSINYVVKLFALSESG